MIGITGQELATSLSLRFGMGCAMLQYIFSWCVPLRERHLSRDQYNHHKRVKRLDFNETIDGGSNQSDTMQQIITVIRIPPCRTCFCFIEASSPLKQTTCFTGFCFVV